MRKSIRNSGLLIIWLLAIKLGSPAGSNCSAQTLSPYVPPSSTVTITPQVSTGNVSVLVSVELRSACYSVGTWGQSSVVGANAFGADAQFWKADINCAQVIIHVSTNYNLGALSPGSYGFLFKAWGLTVKGQAFTVPGLSDMPSLCIVRLDSSHARLSWPTNATDCSLVWALTSSALEWTTVTNTPGIIGSDLVLDVDLDVQQKFFRLHKP